jgi:hypothetical protein
MTDKSIQGKQCSDTAEPAMITDSTMNIESAMNTTSVTNPSSAMNTDSAVNTDSAMNTSFLDNDNISVDAAPSTEITQTPSHSALFGLTGQSSPTKFAGSGPGSSIIGTTGVKGKHNSVSSTDAGGLTGGKTEADGKKSS